MLEDDMLSELEDAFRLPYPPHAKCASEIAAELSERLGRKVDFRDVAAKMKRRIEDGTWASAADARNPRRLVYWKLDTGG